MTLPSPAPQPPEEAIDAQKHRQGFSRLRHALGYSLDGLRASWHESSFRQEVLLALMLIPGACWLGETWVQTSVLVASVVLVMVVELLNTGIEAAIDRFGPERHPLAKKAKDAGSAAVLLSLLLLFFIWIGALWARFA